MISAQNEDSWLRTDSRRMIAKNETEHLLLETEKMNAMSTLHRRKIELYLKQRFGPTTELVTFGPIGQETSGSMVKGYGYGKPIKVTFRCERKTRQAVLETMSPGPFGHEHMADRAQAMLWDFDSYGRLPRHVAALDVGAFTADGSLISVAPAREFFVLNEWAEGTGYQRDLERLLRTGRLGAHDRARARALARYLAGIHRVKTRAPDLYRRRWRELIGHGEEPRPLAAGVPGHRVAGHRGQHRVGPVETGARHQADEKRRGHSSWANWLPARGAPPSVVDTMAPSIATSPTRARG